MSTMRAKTILSEKVLLDLPGVQGESHRPWLLEKNGPAMEKSQFQVLETRGIQQLSTLACILGISMKSQTQSAMCFPFPSPPKLTEIYFPCLCKEAPSRRQNFTFQVLFQDTDFIAGSWVSEYLIKPTSCRCLAQLINPTSLPWHPYVLTTLCS